MNQKQPMPAVSQYLLNSVCVVCKEIVLKLSSSKEHYIFVNSQKLQQYKYIYIPPALCKQKELAAHLRLHEGND